MNQVESGLAAVEQKLRTVVNSDISLLQDASQHIIVSGGKRLRPRLAFLAYLAAGGEKLELVVPLAAAVELVHTATLVHDDINDHSLTRRGKVTVHARWGRTFALLTGDYLFSKVYELMAPYGAEYNVIMADACVSLVEGETLQAAAAKAGSIDQETYKKIIARKTASLFEAAACMGARLAGGDETTVQALGQYAYNLGLAFQIVDDILDIIGDPETLGKPVGGDLVQGAGVLMAHNGHPAEIGAPVAEADPIQAMMARLRESGAIEVAHLQAQEMARRAREALAPLPDSPARRELLSLVDLVVERER
ncbi:MAG: polyprenyl synthetase family protein [Chloroflexi bacterium]|nr:polyprenyl synthetase family protein [Chloroflexota bacterium]MCI0578655.1 polyprenyl synthetase family protein [Chloroflexota bacterium]MCI0647228.1 polyprenyl synthetase family protein [Chloroflexota bacterium]MCI0728954.1 polyprenyl synthetase family protein [Chloroflexota bacterium]